MHTFDSHCSWILVLASLVSQLHTLATPPAFIPAAAGRDGSLRPQAAGLLPSPLYSLISTSHQALPFLLPTPQLLGAMAHCAPKQLGSCLPVVVPRLGEVLADPHPKVASAAKTALNEVSHR